MPLYPVTFKLEDAYGRQSSKTWSVDAVDHAAAVVAAALFVTDLAALTEMEVLQHTVKEVIADSDSVTAGANKDEGATFVVRKANNQREAVKVPSPVAGVRLPDGTIDITALDVTNFFDNFTAGGWRISDGETVTTLVGGTLDQ